jgi:hypothetical protein
MCLTLLLTAAFIAKWCAWLSLLDELLGRVISLDFPYLDPVVYLE